MHCSGGRLSGPIAPDLATAIRSYRETAFRRSFVGLAGILLSEWHNDALIPAMCHSGARDDPAAPS